MCRLELFLSLGSECSVIIQDLCDRRATSISRRISGQEVEIRCIWCNTMAMDEVLSEIKSKIDIVDLISSYVKLKKSGRNYQALCPFHSEKTPSFMVSPELQIFKCFGCSESGDIFSFVMKSEGLEFRSALKLLAEKAGVKLKASISTGSDSRKEKLYKINSLAADFFHFILTCHKVGETARGYLSNRGVSPDTIKIFALGYAPSSWNSLSLFLLKKGYTASEIIEAGLGLPRKNASKDCPIYDRFRQRLMFPLKDNLGRTSGFSGRVLSNKDEPKYLNSPETPIFKKGSFLYGFNITKQDIKKSDHVLVVEGQFDLIIPYQAGFSNIVAALGTALTEVQLSLISRFTKRVTFIFDQDAAGLEATVRSARLAENLGFSVSSVTLPVGTKDPDEAVRGNKEAFTKAVEESLPFYDYYLSLLKRNLKGGDIRQKRNVAEKFLMELSFLQNPMTRSHYLSTLSSVVGMKVETLEEVMTSLLKRDRKGPTAFSKLKESPVAGDVAVLLQRYLISLILSSPAEVAKEGMNNLTADDFTMLPYKGIFTVLKKTLPGRKTVVDAKTIRDKLDELQKPFFDEVYLLDLAGSPESRGGLIGEIEAVATRLKKEKIKKEMEEVTGKIKEAERVSSVKEVEILQKELQRIAEKIK